LSWIITLNAQSFPTGNTMAWASHIRIWPTLQMSTHLHARERRSIRRAPRLHLAALLLHCAHLVAQRADVRAQLPRLQVGCMCVRTCVCVCMPACVCVCVRVCAPTWCPLETRARKLHAWVDFLAALAPS